MPVINLNINPLFSTLDNIYFITEVRTDTSKHYLYKKVNGYYELIKKFVNISDVTNYLINLSYDRLKIYLT